jgi:phospholipid N-methyltransferase
MQSENRKQYSGTYELEESSRYLVRYNTYVASKFINEYKGQKNICEFGAGTGTLTEIFAEGCQTSPDCVEIDTDLISILRGKSFQVRETIDEYGKPFDYVYTSNVLEHIEADSRALKNIALNMSRGGTIAIYVPAFQILYSELDSKVGHYRRYSRNELIRKVENAGFRIESCEYVDFIGFFAAALTKIIGYQGKLKLGDRKSLVLYDTWIFPLSKALDRIGARKLIGKNLYLTATKHE